MEGLGNYRPWADPELRRDRRRRARSTGAPSSTPASPCLPSTGARSPSWRLGCSTPPRPPCSVLRDALKPHRADPRRLKLWSILDAAKAGDTRLLPAAGALALYEPESPRWADLGGKVAQALVTVNPVFLGPWLDALRPVRTKLTAPLTAIFRDKARPETEHEIATSTLADYAADDPTLLADLLMDADPKAYLSLFPLAQRRAEKTVPAFQAELGKTALFDWNDRPIEATWTTPGRRARRTDRGGRGPARRAVRGMPDDAARRVPGDRSCSGCRATARSGSAPYADAAIEAASRPSGPGRDARNWRLATGQTPDEVRRQGSSCRVRLGFPGYL